MAPGWWEERIHPEDLERVLADQAKLLERKSLVHEYRFRKGDGSYIWVHDKLNFVSGGAGGELVGVWTDISRLKSVEGRLKVSKERYRHLFENSPVPLWEEDITALCAGRVKILGMNRAALDLHGEGDPGLLPAGPSGGDLFKNSRVRIISMRRPPLRRIRGRSTT